jgi:transcriptional regulator NrdR family protein
MKVNYVLLYGTPYLKYKLFDTFEKMSDFIVKRSIVNYSIFEKMEDKKEVEMIYRDNDIRVLEQRINKATGYIEENIDNTGWLEIGSNNVKKLMNILKGEDNE